MSNIVDGKFQGTPAEALAYCQANGIPGRLVRRGRVRESRVYNILGHEWNILAPAAEHVTLDEHTVTATSKEEIRKLERALAKAHNAEMKAVAALPENATKAQTDRCWALADAANKARAALVSARARYMGLVR